MVQDSSKKRTGQRGCNSNPVAMLPHAAGVFRMQPFDIKCKTRELTKLIHNRNSYFLLFYVSALQILTWRW